MLKTRYFSAVIELENPSNTEKRPKIFDELFDHFANNDSFHFVDGYRVSSLGWGHMANKCEAYEEALKANGLDPQQIYEDYQNDTGLYESNSM